MHVNVKTLNENVYKTSTGPTNYRAGPCGN